MAQMIIHSVQTAIQEKTSFTWMSDPVKYPVFDDTGGYLEWFGLFTSATSAVAYIASLSVESVMHSDFVKAPLVGLTPTSTLEVGVAAHSCYTPAEGIIDPLKL
jgi:hypothetical protein